jgi:homocitrate synthase
VAHRLTGWNAIKERAEQLQLALSDEAVKKVTAQIKALADQKRLSLDDVDVLLRAYHSQGVGQETLEELHLVAREGIG